MRTHKNPGYTAAMLVVSAKTWHVTCFVFLRVLFCFTLWLHQMTIC